MSGTKLPRFECYQDADGLWRWRLYAANNRILADSGEGYLRERDVKRAIKTVCAALTAISQ